MQTTYPWPASRLDQSHMKALHAVREASPKRTTITELVARAIHDAYVVKVDEIPVETDEMKEAA